MLGNTGSWLQLILILHCIFQTFQTQANQSLQITHSWVYVNFEYPNKTAESQAKKNGDYVPANAAIIDADYYIDPRTSEKRLFVTTPQFLSGIPVTLSVVHNSPKENALMSPFPNLAAQNQKTCIGPVSVYRIYIDRCGLLWVADSGFVNSFLVPRQACQPKLLVYDLKNGDKLILRYEFPKGVVTKQSALNTIVVESYKPDCSDSVAYIADVIGEAMIIFDYVTRTSWRIEYPYFSGFPDQAYLTINGVEFELFDGIFGLALNPATADPRKIYFHSLASIRESWITTAALKAPEIRKDPSKLDRHEFHDSGDIHPGQSSVEMMTPDGILIYTVLPKTALACWNSADPLEKQYQHIFYEDLENLQFISGLKMINESLLLVSCKLQNYIIGNFTGPDIKYRVMMIPNIYDLLARTPCKSRN